MNFKQEIKKMETMKIGDRVAPANNIIIIRVIGGWVYSDMQGSCFIPKPLEDTP